MGDLNDFVRDVNRRRGLIQALWCIDSETGDECLVDIDEHKIIARRIKGKIVDPGESNGKPS